MSEERQDWLDNGLHEPYVPDDGFSARVISALPPRRNSSRRGAVVVALSLGLAWVAAFVLLPGTELVITVLRELLSYRPGAVVFPLTALVVVAEFVAGSFVFLEAD
jgi:hypothetical protein